MLLDPDLIAFLESDCAVIVGLVDDAGRPFATRGWGMRVVSSDPARLRLLLGAAAVAATGRRPGDGARFALAVTGADVLTLRSIQVKGTAGDLQAPTTDDLEHHRHHTDGVVRAIHTVDGTPQELVRRLVPVALVACTVEVDEVFDQTPGPRAGLPVARPA